MEHGKQRITPDEVVKAMKRHNLKAAPSAYRRKIDNNECACGIGAVMLDSGIDPYTLTDATGRLLSLRGLNAKYLSGFIQGFDEGEYCPAEGQTNSDYLEGMRDGVNAHDAVTTACLWHESAEEGVA